MEVTVSVPEGSGYKKPNWDCFKMVVEQWFLVMSVSGRYFKQPWWPYIKVVKWCPKWSWESFTNTSKQKGTKKHIMNFGGEILWSYKNDLKSLDCPIKHILESSWFSKINQPPSRQWTLLHITHDNTPLAKLWPWTSDNQSPLMCSCQWFWSFHITTFTWGSWC